jgi:hypothetical protein
MEKNKNEIQSRGPTLVAWTKVCRRKEQGGLGVLDLHTQNDALLLKNLQNFIIAKTYLG